MSLFSFLSFFGCSKSPATAVSSTPYGPFTVKVVSKHYKTFNMNYGWVKSSHSEFQIFYKDQRVNLGESLQNNTGYSHIWQVYRLEGAPSPTLLAGSQSLYLIYEKNGALQVEPIVVQGSDFASLQFLDSENGQPGESDEVFMSNAGDSLKTLGGGNYLLVSGHAVLHIPDLTVYPFHKDNAAIDNYSFGYNEGAIGFSPDQQKILFKGSFQTWNSNENPKYELCLVTYDFKKDTGTALPFGKTETRLKNHTFINRTWLETFFEWGKNQQGEYEIRLKKIDPLPNWQGHLNDDDMVYELSPVAFEMQKALADFLLEKWHLSPENVLPGDEYSTDQINIRYNDLKFSLCYREEEQELLLMRNIYTNDQEAKYKQLIGEVMRDFNAELAAGKYQSLFTKWWD